VTFVGIVFVLLKLWTSKESVVGLYFC